MSGHSKWNTIKRKKGAIDAKRGKVFSRLAKEIIMAAKAGGGDPDMNARLRTVLLTAKAENMPKDNIKRAIAKGTGEIPGVMYEEQRYECYGPGGVAIIVDILTDNKNRTVGEIRFILSRNNGVMAESGAVTWNFESKGLISIEKGKLGDDEFMEKAIEAGAEDADTEGDMFEVYTAPSDLHAVVAELEKLGIVAKEAKQVMVPNTTVPVDGNTVTQVLRLMELLEDQDDVNDVFSNVEISDEAMAEAMAD